MIEHAWAAGFIDGDGHFRSTVTRVRKDGSPTSTPYLSVTQAGEEIPDVLLRLQKSLMGRGIIRGPVPPHGLGKKPVWTYKVCGIEHMTFVVEKIGPYLSSQKKAQLDEALKTFYSHRRGVWSKARRMAQRAKAA